MARRTAGILLFLTAAACSSGSDGSKDATADAAAPQTGTGDPGILAGTFQVKLAGGVASFIGKVYDGAALSDVVWETRATDGDCALSLPRVPFCDTPCGGSSACVEDDTCKAYPVAHSVGAVTMTGLKDTTGGASFVTTPVANNYQPASGTQLAYPPFDEGDVLKLAAAGEYYAAFDVQTRGIAPLVLGFDSLALSKGSSAKVTWTPPADPSLTKISVKLDVSHHGGSKGKIECTTADDGEIELAAALVSQLIELGVAGFPTVIVSRRSVGSTTIAPGRVDFVAAAEEEKAVTVDGLVSCDDSSQCPTGQTCQSDLSCK